MIDHISVLAPAEMSDEEVQRQLKLLAEGKPVDIQVHLPPELNKLADDIAAEVFNRLK